MQNNVISKIYNFTLDTKKIKPLFDKFDLTTSDSAIWNITIQEDGVLKDISNCSVRLLVNKPGETIPCEQRDNIVVSSANMISIQPKNTMTNVEGRNTYTIVISDIDEEIVCQPFIFNIAKSAVTGVVEAAKDELNTLSELTELIGKSYSDLEFIRQKAKELDIEVNADIQEIYKNVANVDRDVRALEDRIVSVNDKINKLPNRLVLEPIEVAGQNVWYFESPIINKQALSLLDNQFMITAKGKVSNDNITRTCIGSCSFIARPNSSNVQELQGYVNLHNNPIINNRSLQLEVLFGDNLNTTIVGTSRGFKLRVKTNILKSQNYPSETSCVLSNIGSENLV